MPKTRLTRGGGIGPMKVLDAATATSESYARYDLQQPMSNWALQVVTGSSDATVLLQGSIASSSDASFATLLTWSSDTSGVTVYASTSPASSIKAVLDGGASSGGISAWVSGSP
jgi:hypothetical protein